MATRSSKGWAIFFDAPSIGAVVRSRARTRAGAAVQAARAAPQASSTAACLGEPGHGAGESLPTRAAQFMRVADISRTCLCKRMSADTMLVVP